MPQFRPQAHIRRRAEFQRVYDRGLRSHGPFSTVFILANTLGMARLGIAATKKLGGAVQRNRAKRLIRELFRRNPVTAGFDIVVVPKPDLLKASFASLEADYRSHLERRLRQLRAAR
ncbi:MAG TPA: ribonuclease P protein component [Vicinamibacterales bacterium]|nr:ribonuclease P protein component [Vicinamibacterales bacterium]